MFVDDDDDVVIAGDGDGGCSVDDIAVCFYKSIIEMDF